MRPFFILPVLAVLSGAVPAAALTFPANLLPNPGFETGSFGPVGWEKPDKLAYFWEDSGNPGKCLVFDTRVTWEQRHPEAVTVVPRRPVTTRNSGYSNSNSDRRSTAEEEHQREKLDVQTRMKTKGVGAWGSPLRVKPGDWYLLDADYYGPGGAKPSLCVRGYRRFALSEENPTTKKSWFFQVNDTGAGFEDAAYGTSFRTPLALDYVQTLIRDWQGWQARPRSFCGEKDGAGGVAAGVPHRVHRAALVCRTESRGHLPL